MFDETALQRAKEYEHPRRRLLGLLQRGHTAGGKTMLSGQLNGRHVAVILARPAKKQPGVRRGEQPIYGEWTAFVGSREVGRFVTATSMWGGPLLVGCLECVEGVLFVNAWGSFNAPVYRDPTPQQPPSGGVMKQLTVHIHHGEMPELEEILKVGNNG
ncbi:hypothetical protein [Candidatus Magnetaquicoccus inordinatus]|uniref:hypothetical protein n=1 Tax=Candidatus Magnetaquicoccus inordinatus TaxID=2496818 RepID=UPI00102C880B|nr:hypothetical protein [Candidatus Magnetaquicoccus inordinatus]